MKSSYNPKNLFIVTAILVLLYSYDSLSIITFAVAAASFVVVGFPKCDNFGGFRNDLDCNNYQGLFDKSVRSCYSRCVLY